MDAQHIRSMQATAKRRGRAFGYYHSDWKTPLTAETAKKMSRKSLIVAFGGAVVVTGMSYITYAVASNPHSTLEAILLTSFVTAAGGAITALGYSDFRNARTASKLLPTANQHAAWENSVREHGEIESDLMEPFTPASRVYIPDVPHANRLN